MVDQKGGDINQEIIPVYIFSLPILTIIRLKEKYE